MKKLASSILFILYLGASSGATLNLHYCMGKLDSWGFETRQDEKCGSCGMETKDKNDGCCKDEFKQIKVEETHKAAENNFECSVYSSHNIITQNNSTNELLSIPVKQHFNTIHAPPLITDIPAFLRNCCFLI